MTARRLAALYACTVAAAISLALLALAIYFFFVIRGDVARVLVLQRASVRDAVENARASGQPLAAFAPHLANILHDQDYQLTVYDDYGNVLASTDGEHPSRFILGDYSFGIRNYLSFPIRGGYALVSSSNALISDRFSRLFILWLILLSIVCPTVYVVALRRTAPLFDALTSITAIFQAFARGESPKALTMVRAPALSPLLEGFNAASEALAQYVADRTLLEGRIRAFTAEAGHELKTPIAVIIGYIGILRRGALRDADEASRILETMAAEGKRLQVMVQNLLHLARMDAHQIGEAETINLRQLLAAAAAKVDPLSDGSSIRITCPLDLHVRCDPDELQEAIVNVLDNALLYGAPSGVTVTAEEYGREIEIIIADQGPGMSHFEREHAFERFFRGRGRGDVEGSGLGLAITQDVIQSAGGSVAIESEPGKGTTVRLRLPPATVHTLF